MYLLICEVHCMDPAVGPSQIPKYNAWDEIEKSIQEGIWALRKCFIISIRWEVRRADKGIKKHFLGFRCKLAAFKNFMNRGKVEPTLQDDRDIVGTKFDDTTKVDSNIKKNARRLNGHEK